MYPELLRALPVAFLVGVLPGYFWAKLLAPSDDFAGRIAYSAALSLTLVPTAALLQVGIFDSGVTFLIAAISVSVVFSTGVAAYLWLGPDRYADGSPSTPPPTPPGTYSLVPIAVAFGFVLAAALGLMSQVRSMSLAATAVVLAGAIYLAESRRSAPKSTPEESHVAQGDAAWPESLRVLVLTAVLALVVVRGYVGPVRYDWPFLRGGDQFSHAVMSNLMMTEGQIDQYLIYPPGFHTLGALISRLSGLEPLEIFAVIAPALTVLPALSCYVLARRLWGWSYGVVAAFFSGLLLAGPYESFADARYPNIVSANFLIVMAVAALIGLFSSPRLRTAILFALIGSSVVLYHQVASFYEALLLGLIATMFLPYLLWRDRGRALALFSSLALLGVLSVLYAWDTYDLPNLVGGALAGSGAGVGGTAITNAIGSQEPLSLDHLVETTSQPVLWLGLLGAVFAFSDVLRGRVSVPQVLVYLTLLLWSTLMFVGSRTSMSGFPQRFERDLGIPLAVLAALAFVAVLRSLRAQGSAPLPARLVATLAVTLMVVVVGLRAAEQMRNAEAPSSNVVSREVAAAGEWLGEHNGVGNVVVTPYFNDHIPGSSMLAMGGYSGLRSYTQERIHSPRALPPSGKEPLLAAQWVMHHPFGERTKTTLARYDVEHVVLFKGYPGVPWRRFGSRPGAYERSFENDAVVIYTPREISSPSG